MTADRTTTLRAVLAARTPGDCANVPALHIGPDKLPRAVCCPYHWWLPVNGEKPS